MFAACDFVQVGEPPVTLNSTLHMTKNSYGLHQSAALMRRTALQCMSVMLCNALQGMTDNVKARTAWRALHTNRAVSAADWGLLQPKVKAAERGLVHPDKEYWPGPGPLSSFGTSLPSSCLNFMLHPAVLGLRCTLYSATASHALMHQ